MNILLVIFRYCGRIFKRFFRIFVTGNHLFQEALYNINQSTDHLSGKNENYVLRKRPIILSKLTTDGVSFQNKKETDFANLVEGNI